jgi:hypothetical protein
MVHELIDIVSVAVDVPLIDCRIGSFEHDSVQAELVDDARYYVGVLALTFSVIPSLSIITISPTREGMAVLGDQPAHVRRAPAATDLDSELGLRPERARPSPLDQPQNAVDRQADQPRLKVQGAWLPRFSNPQRPGRSAGRSRSSRRARGTHRGHQPVG